MSDWHIRQSLSDIDSSDFSGHTWFDMVVVFCVHQCVSGKVLSITVV